MKQHNYWKISQILGKYSQIAVWLLGAVLLILHFFHSEINFNRVSTSIGIILPVLSGIWMLFEHLLWRTKWVQTIMLFFPFLRRYWTPVLDGRWVGTLNRDGKNRNFVLEIEQDYTSISCITFSKSSKSEAIFAEILYNDRSNTYQLVYYWNAKTRNVQIAMGEYDKFDGFTVLDIITEQGKITKLSGSYFTERQPKQTHGTLELTFQQSKRINQYGLHS